MSIYSPYKIHSGVGLANSGTFGGNTISLIHFDGIDAATISTDEISGIAWTFEGLAQLDTAQLKFGTSSLLVGDTTDFAFGETISLTGANPWTIECFARKSVLATVLTFGLYTAGGLGGIRRCRVLWNDDDTMNLAIRNASNESVIASSSSGTLGAAANTWYHLVALYDGLTFQVYFDGSRVINDAGIDPGAGQTMGNPSSVTAGFTSGIANSIWIDEMRVSKIARYTGATLTQPTSVFVID